MYTSELNGEISEGADNNVYIYLIGADFETEKFWLNKSNTISYNKNLFETGNIDEFHVSTAIDIEKPRKCRIGHDNSDPGAAWFLEKVIQLTSSSGFK